MLIGVDVGGTFTDVVAIRNGEIRTVKVSTNVRDTELAVLEGAREIGAENATVFNHASTHGLNAAITRKLPKIGFLTTVGHRDMLDGGRTWRPPSEQTNPHWRRPFGDAARPLVPRYLRRGINERVLSDGKVLIALDEEQARAELAVLRECGVTAIAICLINAYVNPAHEQRLAELVLEELGDIPCSISSNISPLAKEYARASTTVIDVFMHQIYGGYTRKLDHGLREMGFKGSLNYANCAAELLDAETAMERPFQIVFAGPAAGTVGSAHFGKLIDAPNLLCADIGGTSCDISLVSNGQPFVNTTFELEHDLVVNALSVEVSSIGAGGGSLVTISPAGELLVGPGSAGSDPGPACYSKGGTQPAMTDTCLLIGVIDPDGFAGGRIMLDKSLSVKAFEALETTLPIDDRIRYAYHVGIVNIAEGLANVAIQHGVDVREYSLVAFGAAGPMLLPSVLDHIQFAEVIVPPHPGLFSALGLVSSEQTYSDNRSAYRVLTPDVAAEIEAVFHDMELEMRSRLKDASGEPIFTRAFDGRLLGQSWETPFVPIPAGPITADSIAGMIENFHTVYEQRYGNRFPAMAVQGVTYRLEAVMPTEKVHYPKLGRRESGSAEPMRMLTLNYISEQPVEAGEYQRDQLLFGDRIEGPAIIREKSSTTFMLPGQFLTVGEYGELHIRKV